MSVREKALHSFQGSASGGPSSSFCLSQRSFMSWLQNKRRAPPGGTSLRVLKMAAPQAHSRPPCCLIHDVPHMKPIPVWGRVMWGPVAAPAAPDPCVQDEWCLCHFYERDPESGGSGPPLPLLDPNVSLFFF